MAMPPDEDHGPGSRAFHERDARRALYERALSDPDLWPKTDPSHGEPEPIRITGPGFSGNGRDFNFNPPPAASAGPDSTSASAASAAPVHPWQPYRSHYLGTGDAPADQGLRLRIRPCWVWDGRKVWFPANRNVEILVPANRTDGYFVWLEATLNAEGYLTALAYGHGPALPEANSAGGAGDDGDPKLPSKLYYLLCYVTSDATKVDDLSNTFASSPLQIVIETRPDRDGDLVAARAYWRTVAPEVITALEEDDD